MPTERNNVVRHRLSQLIVIRDWPEVTPALVRSYAKPDRSVPDEDRPERLALLRTCTPNPRSRRSCSTRSSSRARAAFLGSGGIRGTCSQDSTPRANCELIYWHEHCSTSRRPIPTSRSWRSVRACLSFRTIPLTGEELEWLTNLHSNENSQGGRQWWDRHGSGGRIPQPVATPGPEAPPPRSTPLGSGQSQRMAGAVSRGS